MDGRREGDAVLDDIRPADGGRLNVGDVGLPGAAAIDDLKAGDGAAVILGPAQFPKSCPCATLNCLGGAAMGNTSRIRILICVVAALAAGGGAQPHDLEPSQLYALRLQSPPGSPNTCQDEQLAKPFPAAPSGYRRKFDTIGHRFLDAEQGAGDVTPQMYFVLDKVISEALSRLTPVPLRMSADEERAFAEKSLKTIDCVLLRHGFVYPGRGLVQLLSDGLGPTLYDVPNELELLKSQRHNLRRARFVAALGQGPYYVVDCDIASFIYLAIAELRRYPVHLIDIPAHNFVRWDFPNGTSIDFETMDGIATNDDYYTSRWGIPATFVHKGGVLNSMTTRQATAYHDALVAGAWSWRGNIAKMVQFYKLATRTDPTRAFSFNNLGWFYAAAPDPTMRNGTQAVRLSSAAAILFPDGDNLDTLACAYAQKGDFDRALTTEDAAAASGYVPFSSGIDADRALFKAHTTCNDPGFGKDPEPFRPHTATPQPNDRMFFRLH